MASFVKRLPPLRRWMLLFCAAPLSAAAPLVSPSDFITVTTELHSVRFSPGGDIVSITARYRTPGGRKVGHVFESPFVPMVKSDAVVADDAAGVAFKKNESDSAVTVRFVAHAGEKVYVLRKTSYVIDFTCARCGGTVSGKTGTANIELHPPQGGENDRFVAVGKRGVATAKKIDTRRFERLRPLWYGVRNDFWFLAAKPTAADGRVTLDDSSFAFQGAGGDTPQGIGIYAGPIVPRELKQAGPECVRLLYPIWQWMRVLSFGLLLIFDTLLKLTGNTVISILLLSLCVKLICAPLFALARKWQRQVNIQKSLLQPRLDEINRMYRGEEHNRRTLAAYKELGIHPLYATKSLLSAAIQIPVFFAAYHMLSEHIALLNVSFLWVRDLAAPDRLLALPFALPYFGNSFNLLPLIMTAFTVATSYIHTDGSLTPALLRKQRASLYGMAALFFVLLYPCAAGMALYWTMNNILAFVATAFTFVTHRSGGTTESKGVSR